jgi:hypothetical protein
MNNVFIRPGFWVRTKDRVKGALDLRKFIREVLKDLSVPAIDSCCPDTSVGYPVRVDSETGVLEQFDGSTWSIVKGKTVPQTLTGAGAVALTTYATLLVTTGANALTLAAGVDGQRKLIKMKTDGGDGTLTPNSLQGGTTITFNDAGDFVELVYLDGKWNIVVNSGATVA